MKPLCIAILFILSPLCALCADWDLGQNGNVFGALFHPEKSGPVGLNILRAFGEVGAC